MQFVTCVILALGLLSLANGAKLRKRRNNFKKSNNKRTEQGEPCAKLDPHVFELCFNGRNNTRAELIGSVLQKKKVIPNFTICGCFKSTAVPGEDGLDDIMVTWTFGDGPDDRRSYLPCGEIPRLGDIGTALCDGYWHHGCAEYSEPKGLITIYSDCGEGFSGGFDVTLPLTTASLDLSNVGDDEIFAALGGSFQGIKDADLLGCISDVNMYEGVLTKAQRLKNCKSCNNNNGDVFKWSDLPVQLRGEVTIGRPSSALTKHDLKDRCYKPELQRITSRKNKGYGSTRKGYGSSNNNEGYGSNNNGYGSSNNNEGYGSNNNGYGFNNNNKGYGSNNGYGSSSNSRDFNNNGYGFNSNGYF